MSEEVKVEVIKKDSPDQSVEVEAKEVGSEVLPMVPAMAQVRAIDEFRMEFTTFLKEKMIPKTDFGIIPGTGDKPTLLLPGAQKLLNYFGFRSETAIADKVEDHKEGYFYYKYESKILDANGRVLSNGFGSANTKERKWATRPGWDMANTVDKMAQKRALVSAVLGATRASEFYTQDIEDMDLDIVAKKSFNGQSAANKAGDQDRIQSHAKIQPQAAQEGIAPLPDSPAGDAITILTITDKESKKGTPFRLVETDAGKMYVWDRKIALIEGETYFMDVETDNNFVTLKRATPATQSQAVPTNEEELPFE